MPTKPDSERATPIPKVMDVGTFHERFGTDEACLEHLKRLRWGIDLERFNCPDCGHGRGWWLGHRKLIECISCHKQTSVTAGTVFHRIRTPLWKWFWAIYQMAQDKKGIAAMELAKQIDVCHTTAWLMLHKLRRAMRDRTQLYTLKGLVEVDETYVGGRTDGWGSYRSVAKAGYEHEAIITAGGKNAVQTFPWLHTFISNMKRMIHGTCHSVAPKHLDESPRNLWMTTWRSSSIERIAGGRKPTSSTASLSRP